MISICCTTHIHISISYTTLFRSRPGTDAEAVGLVGPVPIRSGKVGEVLVLAGIDELEVIVLIIEVLPVEEVDEADVVGRTEENTSELQSRRQLVCSHLLDKLQP